MSREFTATHPEILWENIVGMRHKVVHDYLGVDEDIVWQVVPVDLPKLVEALEPLVRPRALNRGYTVQVAQPNPCGVCRDLSLADVADAESPPQKNATFRARGVNTPAAARMTEGGEQQLLRP